MSLTEEPELPPPPVPSVKTPPKMVVDASHVLQNRFVLAMYSLYLNGNTPTAGCPADEQRDLTTRLHELENEAEQLKSRADDVTHRVKVELATLKTDMLKERSETEQERDRQHNQVAGCSADEQRDLTTRLHELENEAEQLKSQANDDTCRRKTELATLQMDMLKEHGEMEKERDRQHNQVAGIKC
ncbi:hypothetical protein NP493_5362g00002 [Ridgeia piscesae]|uniref:Uncharacterized protein n=1 Tax=Ridgeia piscesae TaxID=27915 RepID=A0AAD9IUG0_RIDPI|nr:hypothetical protein NP493_5362g00002 [Ridgeia piscesae]